MTPRETLLALGALERLLPGVCPIMIRESSLQSECLATNIANERFLSAVYPPVISEIALLCESRGTSVAGVRSLIGMGTHVNSQLFFTFEPFRTFCTRKWLFVTVNF